MSHASLRFMAWWSYKIGFKTWFFSTCVGLSYSIILLLNRSLFVGPINLFACFVFSIKIYLSSSFKIETYFSNINSLYLLLNIKSACSWYYFWIALLIACRNLSLCTILLHNNSLMKNLLTIKVCLNLSGPNLRYLSFLVNFSPSRHETSLRRLFQVFFKSLGNGM